MNKIDPEIVEFIKENRTANIACALDNEPYAFSCFYAFLEDKGCLVFKSSLSTKHAEMMLQNRRVAGTIIPEKLKMTSIKGIQLEGLILDEEHSFFSKALASYYLSYPFATAMDGRLWVLKIDSIKFTDNTRGFGFKQSWKRKKDAPLTQNDKVKFM